jgi:phenylacetic acid degradation operon negative regulatory protein
MPGSRPSSGKKTRVNSASTEKGSALKARGVLFTLYGDYVRHFGGTIWTGSLITLMQQLGFSSGSVRTALSRVCQQGWLESTREGKLSYYGLTERGRERMEEAAARIFHSRAGAWDGQWTVVTSGSSEGKREYRERLHREMEWLGCGRLTTATWISPNPIARDAIHHLNLQGIHEGIEVFTARHIGTSSRSDIVARCWDIPSISRQYEQFVAAWQPRFQGCQSRIRRNEPLVDSECFADKIWLVHQYRKFLFVDPRLPAELLPPHWPGWTAWQLFRDYYQLLADGAIRFFEQVSRFPADAHCDRVQARLFALRNPFETAREPQPALLSGD